MEEGGGSVGLDNETKEKKEKGENKLSEGDSRFLG